MGSRMIACIAIPAIVFGASTLIPSGSSAEPPAVKAASKPELGPLVVGNDRIGRAGWDRDDAVAFGLGQLAKLIDYVFLATLAMLGLMVKSCVFDRMNAKRGDEPPPLNLWERRTAAFAIAALALSAILGLCAYGYLPRLITAVSFSLNDSIAYLVLLQEVTCGIGMIAIGYFCYLRIFAP